MFPFVSIPPSQSITLRRWHRRRSRRNHDDESDDKTEYSKLRQHSISQIKSTCIKSSSSSSSHLQHIFFLTIFALLVTVSQGRTAFEKMTDLDYVGETYYTIRNLSLYECQGWCREEPECSAASFSFAVNPNSSPPRQETVCLLQNGTQATNPSAKPLRALNQYYMVKMSVRSDKVCKRPWNFERVPNAMIQGHDRALIFTSTKEACLAACLNEKNFICRSAEYNYVTLQCRLSDYDRRSVTDNFKSVQLVEAQGVDYFENLCLSSNGACEKARRYATPNFGLPEQKVALHVGVHFYIDKELMANSEAACERACSFENEFLCRSYLYLGPPTGSDYNCKLYHLDHWTLPDGISAFLNSQTPLIGDGSRIGKYYENRCENPYIVSGRKQPKSFDPALEKDIMGGQSSEEDDTMLCKRVVTKDRRYITQITCFEKGTMTKDQENSLTTSNRNAMRLPVFGKQQNGGALASLFSFPRRQLFGGSADFANGQNGGSSGTSSLQGGGFPGSLPDIISGGGSNGNGASNNGAGGSGGNNGVNIGGGSNGGNVGGGTNNGNTGGISNGGSTGGSSNGGSFGSGTNGGSISGGSNGGSINGGSNGASIGGGSIGGSIGGGSIGGSIGGGSNGDSFGGGSNAGSNGGGSNGGSIGGGSFGGGSNIGGSNGIINGGNNAGINGGINGGSNSGSFGGGNGGNIGGINSGGTIGGGSNSGTSNGGSSGSIGIGGINGGNGNGGGSGNGNGNDINGQVTGQSGSSGGINIGNGQNVGGSNGIGGNGGTGTGGSGSQSGSQNGGSGSTGFNPSLGGQIGLNPGGSLNPGFVPGNNPGSFGPGSGINTQGGINGGNNQFLPGGGINIGSGGGILNGGNGVSNGGNGINNGGSGINNGGSGLNNGGGFLPGGGSNINNGGGNRPGGSGGSFGGSFGGSGDNTVGGAGINVVGGGGGGGGVNPDFGDPDVNCDNQGTCYDVTVHCKDTRIVVNVGTNRPFSGRIYALGRSETCNVDVISSDSFRLDLTMAGQDCNTQSVNGIYTNTVVVQRHSVVMTKTDKIYKVRCTYDTSSRNVTFGMMPIRDPDMISITSAPEAPAPRISILDNTGKEVETVRIGDQLTFKIEIPDKTPYGIFARSCLAMAKDSRSTFAIIDDDGCPIDPTIFPRFTPDGAALVSQYEAFRFTESYGVIFQCNVKYCLGPCPPTNCQYGRESFDSWGRRKRDIREKREIADVEEGRELGETQMRLSHEIIVLDYGDEQNSPFDNPEKTSSENKRDRNNNATDYHATPLDWKNQFKNEQLFDSSEPGIVDAIECPTSRNSVLALAVTCSLLVILYVCTVMCMCYRKAYLCSEEDDDRCSTSTTKSTMLPEAILRGLPSPVVTTGTHGRGGYIPNSRDYMR